MMLDAVQGGAEGIIIGLGGSATNDGGFGMARALGYRFLDDTGKEIREVAQLTRLQQIDVEALVPGAAQFVGRLAQVPLHLVAAADVRNPLLGENGATRTFAEQKGATPEAMRLLEQGLQKLADIVKRDLACDFRNVPGAGAAGGLGFGLMSFAGATMQSGFDVVAEAVDLERKIEAADLILTGEGSLDSQTLEGKTPAGVAGLARRYGKPVFAIVGSISDDARLPKMFDKFIALVRDGISRDAAMSRTAELVRKAAAELGRAVCPESPKLARGRHE